MVIPFEVEVDLLLIAMTTTIVVLYYVYPGHVHGEHIKAPADGDEMV